MEKCMMAIFSNLNSTLKLHQICTCIGTVRMFYWMNLLVCCNTDTIQCTYHTFLKMIKCVLLVFTSVTGHMLCFPALNNEFLDKVCVSDFTDSLSKALRFSKDLFE